jgi:DNA-binding beta-propeller fold protein YncE
MRMTLFAVVWGGFAAACGYSGGASNGLGAASDAGFSGCLSSNECPTGFVCNDFGTCEPPSSTGDAGSMPPPEVEYDFGAPISSLRYVYVAMTVQNELARIDGQTLAVTATAVGKSPKDVATIPGSDGAVVLDSSNGTATIVRPGQNGGPDTIKVLGTLQNLNRLDVDPTGRYAVIWFDLAKKIAEGGLGGVGSFQDVTVVSLATGGEKAVDLTVGFRPRNVQFDAAGNRAYVVTEDGVSVINLAQATESSPTIVPPIPVADPTIPAEDLEVEVVATGDYCAVRQLDSASLRIVSLRAADAGRAYVIPLASAATDIDLAPDGSRVYVVERDAKKLAIVDVPADAIDPSGVQTIDLSDATIGSLVISRDGTRALLFTNATLDERITMVKLDQPGFPHVTWPLKKSVRAVGISPTGDTALVLNAKAPGDPATATSVDDFIDKSYGYSLVDLASGFAKLQITPVDPGSFAYALDGSKVYVTLDGGDDPLATRQLQIVATRTGVVTTDQLGSPPSAVGILPGANQAFVAQRHPLGRVSFAQLVTDALRTVTGFDLNSHVVN